MSDDTPSLVIALHGVRGSGKDTLCSHLIALDKRFKRLAFADSLKQDCAAFIKQYYDGVDVFTASGVDKEWIRPLLIAHGMAMREKDPLYWCRKVSNAILYDQEEREGGTALDTVHVVTDCRFVNEARHLRDTFQTWRPDVGGSAFVLINVTRDGGPSPTDEEEKHYRDVAVLADYHLHWGNDASDQQRARAKKLFDWLGALVATGWCQERPPLTHRHDLWRAHLVPCAASRADQCDGYSLWTRPHMQVLRSCASLPVGGGTCCTRLPYLTAAFEIHWPHA